jgi:FkbM family methyltransferase
MDIRTSAKKYLPVPVADALKAAKYRFDIWTFPKHVVSHRYGPYQLQMNIHDRIAKEWYDKDWDLPPEIDFLANHGLTRGARVFDLGAHQCLIAMILGKLVGPGGQVIAVEANAHNAAIARRNIEANAVANVEVVHALVSGLAGKGRVVSSFNASRAADGENEVGKALVDALTVDELARRAGPPAVVYMDIEGFEIEALKGAAQTIAGRCTWFIELHGDATLSRYHACNRDVLQFFPPADFDCYLCPEDGLEFAPLTDAAKLPSDRCFVVFVPTA